MLEENKINNILKSLDIPNRFKFKIFESLERVDKYNSDLELNSVYLFGSCAKGLADFGSDIDLLLLTNCTDERKIRLKCLHYDLEDDISSIPIQIIVRNIESWNDDNDPTGFKKTVKQSAIKMIDYNNRKGVEDYV